VKVNRI